MANTHMASSSSSSTDSSSSESEGDDLEGAIINLATTHTQQAVTTGSVFFTGERSDSTLLLDSNPTPLSPLDAMNLMVYHCSNSKSNSRITLIALFNYTKANFVEFSRVESELLLSESNSSSSTSSNKNYMSYSGTSPHNFLISFLHNNANSKFLIITNRNNQTRNKTNVSLTDELFVHLTDEGRERVKSTTADVDEKNKICDKDLLLSAKGKAAMKLWQTRYRFDPRYLALSASVNNAWQLISALEKISLEADNSSSDGDGDGDDYDDGDGVASLGADSFLFEKNDAYEIKLSQQISVSVSVGIVDDSDDESNARTIGRIKKSLVPQNSTNVNDNDNDTVIQEVSEPCGPYTKLN